MGETNNLKYLEKTSPQDLIDLLNSDFEQTANQYLSLIHI